MYYIYSRFTLNTMQDEIAEVNISDELIEVSINGANTRIKQAIVDYLNDIVQDEKYFDIVKDTGTLLNIHEWSNKTKKYILDGIINNPKYKD